MAVGCIPKPMVPIHHGLKIPQRPITDSRYQRTVVLPSSYLAQLAIMVHQNSEPALIVLLNAEALAEPGF